MADNNFDLCECVMSHEGVMRRLMNIIRNNQAVCNDRECFTDTPNQDSNIYLVYMAIGWIVLAFFLFMFRPNSMRAQPSPKNTDNRNDRNFDPPSSGIH